MSRRSQLALAGALAIAAALPLVYVAAVHVSPAHWLDAAVLNGFTELNRPGVEQVATFLAKLGDPKPFVGFTAALVAIALLRRRPRTAVAVLVVTGGANVTTQLLKDALPSVRYSPMLADVGQILPHNWPSGHATAAMSLALCAVLVAPARLRPWAATLGAVFAVAVTFSLLTLDWHYPSDVLGGFLVATAWTLAAVAAVWWSEERWPRRSSRDAAPPLREALAPAGVAAAGATLLASVVLIARPQQVVDYAQAHTAFVVGAAVLAAAALVLAAGVSLLVLRAPRR